MGRGELRIYIGAAPGVGKTFAMLNEGWRRRGDLHRQRPGYGTETTYLRVFMTQVRQELEPSPSAHECSITEPGLGVRFEGGAVAEEGAGHG